MRQNPRACKTSADLEIGERFELNYHITEEDLRKFAEISGDWNPVHFDEEYAANSMFRKRIAHGMISLSKFSSIFGMDLPGLGTLWENQEVEFLAPVFLNENYKAIAEVIEKDRRRAKLKTWVEDCTGETVLRGKATVVPISEMQKRRIAGGMTGTPDN